MEVADYKELVIKATKELGTYKPQFEFTINILADLLYQYDITNQRYIKGGMKNQTKTTGGYKPSPIVGLLSNQRKDIITCSDRLGLNPKALDSIKNAQEEKKTGLELALKGFEELIGKQHNSRDD